MIRFLSDSNDDPDFPSYSYDDATIANILTAIVLVIFVLDDV